MPTSLEQTIQAKFTRRLASTPEGRSYILSMVADAESNGETAIFDRALAKVDDAELQAMIRKHSSDELRHARMFLDRAERIGPVPAVPPELRLIDRLDRAVGGLLSQPIEDGRGVMRAFLMLQVIEERATTQFPLMADAMRAVDPGTSATFEAVLADERRHLKYCHAIARRYAPSEDERARTLHEYRLAEAKAFKDNQLASGAYAVAHGFMGRGPASWPWRLAVRAAGLTPPSLTPHARREMEPAAAPAEAHAA